MGLRLRLSVQARNRPPVNRFAAYLRVTLERVRTGSSSSLRIVTDGPSTSRPPRERQATIFGSRNHLLINSLRQPASVCCRGSRDRPTTKSSGSRWRATVNIVSSQKCISLGQDKLGVEISEPQLHRVGPHRTRRAAAARAAWDARARRARLRDSIPAQSERPWRLGEGVARSPRPCASHPKRFTSGVIGQVCAAPRGGALKACWSGVVW